MKVSELEGAELDCFVALAVGLTPCIVGGRCYVEEIGVGAFVILDNINRNLAKFRPTSDWSQGGPIIERERIQLWESGDWMAKVGRLAGNLGTGPTALVAAMRAFVASKYGDTVPDLGAA